MRRRGTRAGGGGGGGPGTVSIQDAYDLAGPAAIEVDYPAANPLEVTAADSTEVLMRFSRPSTAVPGAVESSLLKAPSAEADTAFPGSAQYVRGGTGSSQSAAGNGTNGGSVILLPGTGGTPTDGNGGAGGEAILGGGAGAGAAGVGTNRSGGAGGAASTTAGNGGAATGTGTAGDGGNSLQIAGAAGAVVSGTVGGAGVAELQGGGGSASSGTANAGAGGYAAIIGGNGGAASAGVANGGAGALAGVYGGNGGTSSGGTGGAGGDAEVDAGAGAGAGAAGKVKIGETNATEVLFGAPVNLQANFLETADIAAPANPGAGKGRLYKVTGNDGLWWLPDAGGDAVDLTAARFVPVTLFAPSLDNPVTADWAVNALAPAVADPTSSSITVREFDDTAEEGVGFMLDIPTGAVNIIFKGWGRAQTAPGAARTVGQKIYTRDLASGAATAAWTAGTVLDDIAIGTNAFWVYFTQTIALSTLSLTAGRLTLFERTRRAPAAGTNLTGNFLLAGLSVAYT